MRVTIAAMLVLFQVTVSTVAWSKESPQSKAASEIVVARVLGKPIYRRDIEEDKRFQRYKMQLSRDPNLKDDLRRYRASLLYELILAPLERRYLEARSLQSTPAEIKAYSEQENRKLRPYVNRTVMGLEHMRQELNTEGLSENASFGLLMKRNEVETALSEVRQMTVSSEACRSKIDDWKFKKAIYDQYRNQDLSLTGAMREWVQAARRAGDYVILDASLRKDFGATYGSVPERPSHIWELPEAP